MSCFCDQNQIMLSFVPSQFPMLAIIPSLYPFVSVPGQSVGRLACSVASQPPVSRFHWPPSTSEREGGTVCNASPIRPLGLVVGVLCGLCRICATRGGSIDNELRSLQRWSASEWQLLMRIQIGGGNSCQRRCNNKWKTLCVRCEESMDSNVFCSTKAKHCVQHQCSKNTSDMLKAQPKTILSQVWLSQLFVFVTSQLPLVKSNWHCLAFVCMRFTNLQF